MNWQKEAIDDLKNYEMLKDSLCSIKMKIAALNQSYKAVAAKPTDTVTVQGGDERAREEKLLENIAERERLNLTYKANEMLVRRIEDGLGKLSDEEKLVLEEFFIKNRKNGILELSRKLSFERSKLYCMRNEALKRFTMAMYGISEF